MKSLGTLAIGVLLLSSCSLAPVTPRVEAEPLGKGNVKIAPYLFPTPAFSVSYGATEKLDIGADIEQLDLLSLWSRYNLINTGTVALAATGGVFISDGPNKAKGFFLGPVFTTKLNERVHFFSGYRFSRSDYGPCDDGFFSGCTEDHFLDSDITPRDEDDLSNISQLYFGVSINLGRSMGINVGPTCLYFHENEDSLNDSHLCGPTLGLSWDF